MDSAIGEDLFAINNCRTSHQDDCFSVLDRAGENVQLNILEAIYIAIDRPSLCRQRSSHILNTLGDALDTGVMKFFFFLQTVLFQFILITRFYHFPALLYEQSRTKGSTKFIF